MHHIATIQELYLLLFSVSENVKFSSSYRLFLNIFIFRVKREKPTRCN